MPLIISTDDSIYDNDLTLSGSPAVEITGNRVTFTNKADGQINAADGTGPAILLTGTGSLLVNQEGGRIEANFGYLDAIVGSSGTDTIDNYGVIYGWARLGEGNDSFTEHRTTAAPIAPSSVDLGGGDDTFTLINFPGQNLMPTVYGGSGNDTAVLSGPISVIYGSSLPQFEHLVVGLSVSNLAFFNGLSSIILTPGGFNNFLQSMNPTLDLSIDGNILSISGSSSFHDIFGSSNSDTVTLRSSVSYGAPSVHSIDLGAGSDLLTIDVFDAAAANPIITGTINGGTGSGDRIQVLTRSTSTVDLVSFSGFESLVISTQFFGAPGTGRVTNANQLLEIDFYNGSDDIALGQSFSPNARISAPFLKSLVIEATTTVGQFGFAPGTYAPANIAEITQPDAQFDLNVNNSGTILGAVRLYIGNDVYDGSLGTTGDTIYGYAGNDTLTGGSGSEQIFGGFGDDTVNGGGGIDTLDGGAGTDTLVISGAVTPGAISNMEAIELVGGATLTLSAAQFNTGFYNPIAQVGMASVSGTGSLILNLDPNPVTAALYLTSLSFVPGSSVTLTINGTSGLDAVKGAPGVSNTINGGDEADQIRGGSLADTINGGGGNDKLFGWSGSDVLTGGAGSDQFRYFFTTDSGLGAAADRITDFQIGTDKFNFVIIDADPITPDDQAFTFLGTGAFTSPGTGQIRFQDSGADLLVQVDVDGNGTVDMEMVLQGLAGQILTSGDFML